MKPFSEQLDLALSDEIRTNIKRPFWVDTVGLSRARGDLDGGQLGNVVGSGLSLSCDVEQPAMVDTVDPNPDVRQSSVAAGDQRFGWEYGRVVADVAGCFVWHTVLAAAVSGRRAAIDRLKLRGTGL